MKIFQLILSNSPSADLRYAEELYNGINMYFKEYEIKRYILNDNSENLLESIINIINTYDYLFIHNLGNNKDHYIKISKLITCKKILFITNQKVKKFISKIDIEYIKILLSSCDKIVLNKHIKDFINTIISLSNSNINDKLVQLNYIYNVDYSVIDIPKYKEIIQISNKGLESKYDLFINLFENKQDYFKDFIWKIYGVEKNIQTLSIDKLYIDKKTNTPSDLTNFDQNKIYKDKINIYPSINNKKIKDIIFNTYFICCFDNYDFINYTILDIIYSGSIPIMNIKYAKNIKINNKQSIYDILNGIYINDKKLINNNTIVDINKYIQSEKTYKSLVLRNIKMCDQLFNPKKNINELMNKIYESNN